jgi:hypothetical protein
MAAAAKKMTIVSTTLFRERIPIDTSSLMGHLRQDAVDRRWRFPWILVLATGLLMQIWFWLRSVWIYLDQVELYQLGMVLAREGELLPFGKISTGGMPIPGVVLELLVGLPLMVWLDLRASTLVLVLFHLAGALLLSWVLAQDFGWRFATLYLIIFWLSPWRFFYSGFLWETNYLLLPAVVHLVSCRALRDEARVGASVLLVATILLTAQIHSSALILGLSCLILLMRRRIHLHLGGAALGAVLGSLSLLPTIMALVEGSGLPVRLDAPASLLTRLNSVEKALVYWLRLGSLDVGRRFRQSLFCTEPGGGDTVPQPLLCHLLEITQILALASVLVALAAGWWFLRRSRGTRHPEHQTSTWCWYRNYTSAMLLAVMISAFLSPVLIQGWHVLIALPIACLPVAAWVAHRWPTGGSLLRATLVLFLLWRVPASLLLLGHPMYTKPTSPELPRHIVPPALRILLPESDHQGAD